MIKSEARKLALASRKNEDVNVASSNVLEAIITNKAIEKFDNIGIYYPIGNEINIMELVNRYPNKKFYLPVTKDNIYFVKYSLNDILVKGPYRTMEPVGDEVSRDLIDCFIVPCVGITKDNKRIGYGAGYYDRYLAGYKGHLIGIVYKNAVFNDVVGEDHDIVIDEVIVG